MIKCERSSGRHHFYSNWVICWLMKMCHLFSNAPANSTAAANSNDNLSENFVHEINSTAQYYPRKYGGIVLLCKLNLP